MTNKYSLAVEGDTITALKAGSPIGSDTTDVKEIRLTALAEALQEGELWSGAETYVPDNFQISEEFPFLYEAVFQNQTVYLTKNPTELIYRPSYPQVAETLYSVIPEGVCTSSFSQNLYINREGVYLYEKEGVIYLIDPAGDDRETRDVSILTRSHVSKAMIKECVLIINKINKKRSAAARDPERTQSIFLTEPEVDEIKDRIHLAMLAVPQFKVGGMV